QLIDHRVDGVLELENFSLHIHGDLAGEVATRHGRGHLSVVAHLCRQIAGHEVDRVGEIFPGTGDPRHVCLAAEPAFGADFARHARYFTGERTQLIDHRVDCLFELEDFATHIDRDLA